MFALSEPQLEIETPSLIHFVHEDDQRLLSSSDGLWFKILFSFPWRDYRTFAAKYYESLYQFNIQEEEKRKKRTNSSPSLESLETKSEAKQRLLFDRVTMSKTKTEKPPILYQGETIEYLAPSIDPEMLAPGKVPLRSAGKKPKCFYGLLKAFLGTQFMGFPTEPETVHQLLRSNPSFVRVCGFISAKENEQYYFKNIPSLRKLEQFDQIMREYGIWNLLKLEEVQKNIESKIIAMEEELVGDTTHYYAYSGFETVIYTDEKGKKQKKSQSKTTKSCHCDDWTHCNHPWVLADDGAGTICKSNKKMHWGHKASILGFPKQGIPLDAVAVSDAATFDGETLFPHVEKLFDDLPEVKPHIRRVLYDSACDSQPLKNAFQEKFEIDLKASFNPRRRKDVAKDLPRGIKKITPYAVPICWANNELEYQGTRYKNEKFIYHSPKNEQGESFCFRCDHRKKCCPNSSTGRRIEIAFDVLPHIDPKDPPMAKRFKAIMSRRPSVERMIKRLKCDLSDDRLTKRGNTAFQAYLDKTMIAFHILLRS